MEDDEGQTTLLHTQIYELTIYYHPSLWGVWVARSWQQHRRLFRV